MKTKRPNRRQALRETVAGHPFLEGMKPKHLDALAELAREVRFADDAAILQEGRPARCFYLLVEGDVALDAHIPNGSTALIHTLHAGDALGWSWMFEPRVWHFDARALTTVRALRFDADKLLALCDAKPRLGMAIHRRITGVMMKRLQATRLQMLDWYGDQS